MEQPLCGCDRDLVVCLDIGFSNYHNEQLSTGRVFVLVVTSLSPPTRLSSTGSFPRRPLPSLALPSAATEDARCRAAVMAGA